MSSTHRDYCTGLGVQTREVMTFVLLPFAFCLLPEAREVRIKPELLHDTTRAGGFGVGVVHCPL